MPKKPFSPKIKREIKQEPEDKSQSSGFAKERNDDDDDGSQNMNMQEEPKMGPWYDLMPVLPPTEEAIKAEKKSKRQKKKKVKTEPELSLQEQTNLITQKLSEARVLYETKATEYHRKRMYICLTSIIAFNVSLLPSPQII